MKYLIMFEEYGLKRVDYWNIEEDDWICTSYGDLEKVINVSNVICTKGHMLYHHWGFDGSYKRTIYLGSNNKDDILDDILDDDVKNHWYLLYYIKKDDYELFKNSNKFNI